jgi:hypothetical protein
MRYYAISGDRNSIRRVDNANEASINLLVLENELGRYAGSPCRVRTVFLGQDDRRGMVALLSPILWRTEVVGGPRQLAGLSEQCSGDFESAQRMHNRMVNRILEELFTEDHRLAMDNRISAGLAISSTYLSTARTYDPADFPRMSFGVDAGDLGNIWVTDRNDNAILSTPRSTEHEVRNVSPAIPYQNPLVKHPRVIESTEL